MTVLSADSPAKYNGNHGTLTTATTLTMFCALSRFRLFRPISEELLKVRRCGQRCSTGKTKANPDKTLHSLVFIRPNPLFAVAKICLFMSIYARLRLSRQPQKELSRKGTVAPDNSPCNRPRPLAGSLRFASCRGKWQRCLKLTRVAYARFWRYWFVMVTLDGRVQFASLHHAPFARGCQETNLMSQWGQAADSKPSSLLSFESLSLPSKGMRP